ncbi:MAG: 4-hydroxy-tetrahydrodipicolinate synthase [Endomicrobium sp.]|jgi:4-hydroxy-tetrahydrodipicolinate synthase|nr:4-hydroxy-tetrahydrodipicolinate synthase [Endomicrobium sp.]
MFSGVYTALLTPFNNNNKVDFNALDNLLNIQILNGVDGIVPCGTTGESATLTTEEHKAVIEFCVKKIKGKIKILAGTGSNCTEKTIQLTKFAEKIGCDGALVVSPYYNKPTQNGLYLHFKAIADSVKIPIVLYNIEGRTSINIDPSTVTKICQTCKNVIGIKEASGSLKQMSIIKLLNPNTELISGDDILTLPLLSIGGVGVISVLSNILPLDVVSLVKTFKKGNINDAIKIHYRLLPLMKTMFIETNPIPVKTAASLLNLCELKFRLPMCQMKDDNKTKLVQSLYDYELLKLTR